MDAHLRFATPISVFCVRPKKGVQFSGGQIDIFLRCSNAAPTGFNIEHALSDSCKVFKQRNLDEGLANSSSSSEVKEFDSDAGGAAHLAELATEKK